MGSISLPHLGVGQDMNFSGPADSFNARTAAEVLNLADLKPRATPEVHLDLSPEEIVRAFPGAQVEGVEKFANGRSESLTVDFSLPHEPYRSRINVSIMRIKVEEVELAIRMSFALFSRPIRDLGLTKYSTPDLDLLADFAATDDYAIAVKGSFLTTVRGRNAKNIARTIINLLFVE